MKQKIKIGNVLLNTLNILILKVFTLPFTIYKNALISLSTSIKEQSENSNNISGEFPIYSWFISIIETLIVISYPLGFLTSIYILMNATLVSMLATLLIIYFTPLYLSLIKELLQITLKVIAYLKIISNK